MKPDRILEHECLERLRREVRRNAWHGYLMQSLVLLVCVVVLWWVMPPAWREAVMQWVMPRSALNEEWRMMNEEFLIPHSGFDIPAKRAGFGVPEWVAFGIVGTMVLGLLGRLAWGAIMEGKEADTLAMPPEHDPLQTVSMDDPPWMRELMAFFQRRGVVLSKAHCWALRARAEGRGAPGMVPDERLPLLLLDAWMREHLRLRLYVSTLKEVQAICLGKGVVA